MNPRGDSLKTVAGEISEITDQTKPKGDKFQTVAGEKKLGVSLQINFFFHVPALITILITRPIYFNRLSKRRTFVDT